MGIRLIAGILAGLILFSGCNVNKYLRNDEYLIEKNEVLRNGTKIDKGNIEAFVRQKPNRRFLGTIRFNLWLYNQVDQEKMRRIKQKRDARYDSINARRIIANDIKNKKRIARGRKPKEPKLKDKDKLTFRENILEVGEPPVLLDTFLTNLTTKKMQRYVHSKGYFDSKVTDSIVVDQKNKRASVFYSITKSEPYRIRQIKYKIEDPLMEYFVFNDTINTLIKRGRRFDEELFQRERTRMVDVQLDNGYYYFAPQYIYFLADTGLTGNVVDLTIGLKKFSEPYSATNDSLVYKNHPRFTINRVYIVLENLQGTVKNTDFRDTSLYKGIYFLSNEPLRFRRRDIAKQISVAEGQLYQQSLAEDTYKALTGLRVFKAVSVQYVPNRQYSDKLDCYIYCPPVIKQAQTTEVEGTNTSGNLGIAGSIVFQNKNAFRGAELVELKLKGAITAQQQFNNQEQGNINGLQSTFNTYQLGPELNIYFPRPLFPFNLFYYKKDEKSKRIFAQPKTYLNMSFNYQSRFEYSRTITNVSYGFRFNNYRGLFQYDVIPLEIYSVKAKLYGSFEQDLININDFFLLNSFRDHLTPLSKVSATYNNQSISTKKRYYTYAKLSLSSSGNIMRGIYNLTNQPKDTAGRYNIAGVPFSQFVKVEADWRFYVKARRKNMLVFRMAGGIGKPLANLNVLPYEQSFFSGGPNSVRAWRARTLGPGSYDPSSNSARYDKLGDLQLEGNFEYRFHIFKSFYGAWFADAGNVWLLKPQVSKPNGDFELDRFYKEFGVGSGFGLRYDFSFFVLRLDAAMRIYDPKYAENDRWTFDKKPVSTTILNFGIGYPF